MIQLFNEDTLGLVGRLRRYKVVSLFLEALDCHNHETFEHSLAVGYLGVDLGISLGFREESLRLLGTGLLLHDIGKLRINRNILDKPGKLNESELGMMHKHPLYGYKALEGVVLNGIDMLDVRKLVISHHEYHKAHPYIRDGDERRRNHRIERPRRNMNGRIQTLKQIVSVCDLVEALDSERVYKPDLVKREVEAITRRDFTGNPKYIDAVLERIYD
ncbi:MAG: HD domain-containing protein [archaeon]